MGVSTNAILFYGVELEEGEITGEDLDEKGLDFLWSGNESGIGWGTHCASEYPIYFIATKEITVSRGDCIDVDQDLLLVEGSWRQKIIDFCKEYDLPVAEGQEPGWRLCSYWG